MCKPFTHGSRKRNHDLMKPTTIRVSLVEHALRKMMMINFEDIELIRPYKINVK